MLLLQGSHRPAFVHHHSFIYAGGHATSWVSDPENTNFNPEACIQGAARQARPLQDHTCNPDSALRAHRRLGIRGFQTIREFSTANLDLLATMTKESTQGIQNAALCSAGPYPKQMKDASGQHLKEVIGTKTYPTLERQSTREQQMCEYFRQTSGSSLVRLQVWWQKIEHARSKSMKPLTESSISPLLGERAGALESHQRQALRGYCYETQQRPDKEKMAQQRCIGKSPTIWWSKATEEKQPPICPLFLTS